jgi:hypothetical protein
VPFYKPVAMPVASIDASPVPSTTDHIVIGGDEIIFSYISNAVAINAGVY